jgi:hypothetical protein
MKRFSHLLAGAIALAALLPIGCKSDSSAGPAAGDAPEAAEAPSDPIATAVDTGVRDLAAKVKAQATTGWPPEVMLSSSEPRRPVVAIRGIVNKTSFPLDTSDVEERLARALLDGGHVIVAASGRAREEARDERAMEESMGGSGAASGVEDAPGLVLVGELTDDVADIDGKRTHQVVFKLRLTDTKRRSIVLQAQGETVAVANE